MGILLVGKIVVVHIKVFYYNKALSELICLGFPHWFSFGLGVKTSGCICLLELGILGDVSCITHIIVLFCFFYFLFLSLKTHIFVTCQLSHYQIITWLFM